MKKIVLALLIVLTLAPVARASSPAMPLATLSVIGTWKFHDRSGAVVPANTFLVELLTGSGTHLAWDYTDTGGSFFLGPVSFPAEPVKVRIWTYTAYADGSTLMVVREGGVGLADAYFWDTIPYSPDYNPPPYVPNYIFSVDNKTVPAPSRPYPDPKAWWLQDDLRRGFLFLPTRSGSFTIEPARPATCAPPPPSPTAGRPEP